MKRIRNIWILIIITILFRFLFLYPLWNNEEKSIVKDSYSYEAIALNLIEGNGYSHCEKEPFYKDVIRTPVYPLFIAGTYKIFGQSYISIVVFQMLMTLVTVLLIYKIGANLYNENVGFIAGILLAINGHLIAYNGFILTETLFTLLLVIIYYLIFNHTKKSIFFLGPILAIWVLTRPVAILIIPLIIMFAIYYLKDRFKMVYIISSLIFGLIIVLPWTLHFKNATGKIGVSSIRAYNTYLTFANGYLAQQQNINENSLRKQLATELQNPVFGDCQNNYEYISEMEYKGREIIKDDFWGYLYYHFKSSKTGLLPEVTTILEMWGYTKGGKGTLAVINKDGLWEGVKYYFENNKGGWWIVVPLTIVWIITLMGMFIGLFTVKHRAFQILSIVIILYFLIVPGPASSPRFLTPVVPIICLISGFGIVKLKT